MVRGKTEPVIMKRTKDFKYIGMVEGQLLGNY